MDEESKLVIHLVETPECCFITDCVKSDGYGYQYHRSGISELYFDGEKAEPTFERNWMKINQFPKTIERDSVARYTNERYELEDKDIASTKLPIVIAKEERENYSDHIIETLYRYKYEMLPLTKEVVDATVLTVLKLDEYSKPSIAFEAIGKFDYADKTYSITSTDLNHQMLDKIIFPEVCLAHRPCSLTSKQVYAITRQYVLSHIDSATAKVTSNYDFCFTVKKIVPKMEPETVTYHNMFARTKKERAKVKTSVKTYTEYEIFAMTNDQDRHQGYAAIPGMVAKSEAELQEKMDEWLTTLIAVINTPLQECPHCKGTGLLGEVERVNHKVLVDISAKDTIKS